LPEPWDGYTIRWLSDGCCIQSCPATGSDSCIRSRKHPGHRSIQCYPGSKLESTGRKDGGAYGAGVVYKLDPQGHETVLHSFVESEGAKPYAGVIRDSAGNLYGTTEDSGIHGQSVVFQSSHRDYLAGPFPCSQS
jgi:uncharacterized repeat protein (TIGR03803 family)